MEKRTIIKISGVVIAFAGIFGTAAYMENRKEDKLGDENAYMRIRPATGKVRDGNKKSFYARYVKRGLDFVLSALGLVMLLPLLAYPLLFEYYRTWVIQKYNGRKDGK